MAFTEVAWANADTVTEVKLDQMVASDVHVREEANYYPIVTAWANSSDEPGNSPTCEIEIDGTGYGSGVSGTGTEHESDINITGLSDGIHTIKFITNCSVDSEDMDFVFYKSADLNLLTYWATMTQSGTPGYYDRTICITVICHRTTKSWT